MGHIYNFQFTVVENSGIASLFDESTISSKIMKALLNIQKDKMYKDVDENSINDGIRNQLSMIYDVKDQTRCGDSTSGIDSGEIDIMLCNDGNPVVIIEGLRLDYINNDYLDEHINKALINYDPVGCPLVYILIYARVNRFDRFWYKVMSHMSNYRFPYEIAVPICEITTPYSESRHAKMVLNRNGRKINVHLYAVAMR